MIPHDTELEKAVRQQKIVSIQSPNSRSAKAFAELAEKLVDGTSSESKAKWGISEIFSRFLTKLGDKK